MPSSRTLAALAAAAVLFGGACSSSDSPKPAAEVETSTTVTTVPAKKAFDAQAYCMDKLAGLQKQYPKSLGGSDLAAECKKMISETGAESAKTIDALLETAESFYKLNG